MQESTAAKSFEIGEGSTSTSPEGGGGRGDRRHTRARPRPPSGTLGRARGEVRRGRSRHGRLEAGDGGGGKLSMTEFFDGSKEEDDIWVFNVIDC